MKKWFTLAMKCTSCLALLLTIVNVNATCGAIAHQPKLPAAAMKFKK